MAVRPRVGSAVRRSRAQGRTAHRGSRRVVAAERTGQLSNARRCQRSRRSERRPTPSEGQMPSAKEAERKSEAEAEPEWGGGKSEEKATARQSAPEREKTIAGKGIDAVVEV